MSENDALKRIIGSLKLELEEAKRAIKIPSSKYYQTKDGVIIVEKDDTLIHIYCKDNTIFIEKCRPQS